MGEPAPHSPGNGCKETEESLRAYRSSLQDDPRLGHRLADPSGAHLLCEVCGPEDPCHADEIISHRLPNWVRTNVFGQKYHKSS